MRAVVSIVMRKMERSDGTYPLALRIYKDERTRYVNIGCNILEKHWDADKQKVKKSHPNSVWMNNFLSRKKDEATETTLEIETREKKVSVDTIIQKVIAPYKGKGFFAFAEEYLETLKASGNYNVYTVVKPRIKHFRTFAKGEISFENITPIYLMRFQAYLTGERQVGDRTVSNYLILIRSLFNQAIAANIVDRRYYPFGRDKVKVRIPDGTKIGLTEDELVKLVSLDLDPTSFEYHARNLWLFSFYLAGIRCSDVLRITWNDIRDGRLHYTMGKNNKVGSLKLPEKAIAILNWYKAKGKNNHNLVFPDLNKVQDFANSFDLQRKSKQAIKMLDIAMIEIGEQASIMTRPTMHIARHTFGNLAGDKISLQMLQKLYRHSSITTTINYQKHFMYKDADEALDAVINF